jgi:hypothetical protein
MDKKYFVKKYGCFKFAVCKEINGRTWIVRDPETNIQLISTTEKKANEVADYLNQQRKL